jgi:hypothetical protein
MTPIEMLEALQRITLSWNLSFDRKSKMYEARIYNDRILNAQIRCQHDTPTEAITWLYQNAKELGVL